MQAAGSTLPHPKDPKCLTPWRLCPKARHVTCHSRGRSAAGGCDTTTTMGDTMQWQMSGGGWEGWRTGNFTSAPAPAIPKGLPAQVANVELHAGNATSGGAFTFPFPVMPLFSFHAIQGKLARCASFIQLIFERHINTNTPRTSKGIISSACKKPCVKVPLREKEELLAKQQNTSNYQVSGQGSGKSKKQAGKAKEESNRAEERSSCKVMKKNWHQHQGNMPRLVRPVVKAQSKLQNRGVTLTELQRTSTLCR